MPANTPTSATIQLARDRKLVRKLLAGQERAFQAFVNEYFPKLYRYARHRLGNDQDVQEVVQTALAKAAQHIDTYRGEATLLTWLIRICGHEISRHLGKAERSDLMQPFLNDDVLRAVVESIESTPDGDPELLCRRNELITLIQFALDQLPERYALALELKYIEGCSSQEISSRFGIGDQAVQSLLARARRAFRDVCGEAILTVATR